MRKNVLVPTFPISGMRFLVSCKTGRAVNLPVNGLDSRQQRPATRNQKIETRKLRTVATSGYLLLEVLLALSILSIVVVMVFQIIQTTLRVTSEINFLQTQQRKVDGICELLRRNFVSMPQTCVFQTRNQNGSMELLFRYAPFSFSWAKTGAKYGTVVIGSRPQVRW